MGRVLPELETLGLGLGLAQGSLRQELEKGALRGSLSRKGAPSHYLATLTDHHLSPSRGSTFAVWERLCEKTVRVPEGGAPEAKNNVCTEM